SAVFSVLPNVLDHFTVSNPNPTPTAGVPFTVTVAAFDQWGNIPSAWVSGNKCVVFSGAGSSPSGKAPDYPAPGTCPTGSSVSFTAGSATPSVTLYNADPALPGGTSTTKVIVTRPGGSETGSSGTFT